MTDKKYRFEITLEEQTYKNLSSQAKKSKKTKSQFIRDLINKRHSNKKLIEIEKTYLLNTRIVLDISRVTGNINQIAYQLNKQEITFDEYEFYATCEELINSVKEAMTQIKSINNKIKAIL